MDRTLKQKGGRKGYSWALVTNFRLQREAPFVYETYAIDTRLYHSNFLTFLKCVYEIKVNAYFQYLLGILSLCYVSGLFAHVNEEHRVIF